MSFGEKLCQQQQQISRELQSVCDDHHQKKNITPKEKVIEISKRKQKRKMINFYVKYKIEHKIQLANIEYSSILLFYGYADSIIIIY